MDPTELPLIKDPTPIPDSAFVASGARVIGDVRLGIDSSIWYNAVVRGDINHIEVGARSNVQDGCIVHYKRAILRSGSRRYGWSRRQLHACTVEDGCLIGMGAIILSGAYRSGKRSRGWCRSARRIRCRAFKPRRRCASARFERCPNRRIKRTVSGHENTFTSRVPTEKRSENL